MKLQDRVILITGASQGLGAEAARACAEAGATVVLVGRSQKKLEKVYDAIVSDGCPEPFAVVFDLLAAEEQEYERLAQTVAEWVNQYRINTVAPMALTRACLPMLQAAEDASVAFIGESHGETPQAYWGGFGASKAALNYLCKVAADEWSRFPNLRANVLVPGPINSPQRMKTHPGESRNERRELSELAPEFVYWMSGESKGRSGEIVYL